MESTLDRLVLQLVRERRLVAPAALESATRAVATAALDGVAAADGVLEWLVEHGELRRAQLAELILEVTGDPPTRAEPPREAALPLPPPVDRGQVAGAPPPAGQRPPEVPTDWSRYIHFSVVGEGGMGTVYRAFDPRLERWVALKFLRADDRVVAEACLREARAQARVDHENICQIYEVGEVARRLYISMQFIHGRTLRSLAGELTSREVAEIGAQVARALHAAHLEGLIHRDIKPSNIMVERTADGRWRPFILDFGLARDLTRASGHTVEGAVLGTPSYMAPEQVRGQVAAIDPRTDVYALGATLFEVLSGSPPFEGTVAEVLVKVLQDDAPPLRSRRPELPADLAAIVDRCMDKDPARRYPTALALAEDMERFLADEPVTARARSSWYVILRRLKRNRVAAGAATLALVAVAGATFLAVSSVVAVRRQAELSQTFARELTTLEESVRLVVSRPLHDIRPELARVRERLDWIAAEAARAGRIGAGPGNHALASGYMALGEHARAEEFLRRAWAAGYRPAEVAHALALVLIARYREALTSSQRLGDPELQRARHRQLDEAFRRPALAFLEQARGAVLMAPELAEAQIAFLEERLDDALAKARRARQRIPWLYQALHLEGEVYLQQGRELLERGATTEALAALAQAREAYQQAVAQAPSHPLGYSGLCEVANTAFLARAEQGATPETSYQEALAACGQALVADPDHLPAHRALALAHLQWAQHQARRGQDPSAALAQATASAQGVIQRSPGDAQAWTYLGIAARFRAELTAAGGGDPRPDLERARDFLRRAVELEPPSYLAQNNLGLALLAAGLDRMARGEDPRPLMGEAEAEFQALLARHPHLVAAMDNLSVALWAIGRWEYAHGGEGKEAFDRAEEVLRRALAVNPADGVALNNLGLIAVERGSHLLSQDSDPTAPLTAGLEALERAIALNPDDPFAYTNLGQLYRVQAAWEHRQKRSPAPALARARQALARAQAINPVDAEAVMAEGLCHLLEARTLLAQGRDPDPIFARAQGALRRALAINPAYLEARRELARVHLERAAWLARRPPRAFAEIEAGFEALADLPASPDTLALRGELELLRARLATGEERRETARRAAAALAGAIAGNRWLSPSLAPLLEQAHAFGT